MDRRKRLLNETEKTTQEILDQTVVEYGARAYPKVRIADAIDIANSGLTSEQYSYALKAHFDFIVSDREDTAVFAVEFDGGRHENDAATIYRDMMKNRICEILNMPILRINSQFFRRIERFNVLSWLTHLWFLNAEFARQQETGDIPPYEVLHYGLILSEIRDGNVVKMPYDPFIRSRARLQRLRESGIRQRLPSRMTFVKDPKGYAIDICIVDLPNGRVIVGIGKCRSFHFVPVSPFELAGELAVFDAAQKVDRYLKGSDESSDVLEADEWLQKLDAWKTYR